MLLWMPITSMKIMDCRIDDCTSEEMIEIDFSNLMSLLLYRFYTRSTVTIVPLIYSLLWIEFLLYFLDITRSREESEMVRMRRATLKRGCALNLRGKNTNLFFLSFGRTMKRKRNATHASHYYKFRVKAGIMIDDSYKKHWLYIFESKKKNTYIC